MLNQQLAEIFYQIAEYLDMKDVRWKPRAYEKAARILESMSENAEDIYKEGGIEALQKIPGVGINIAERIEEFIKTGKIKDYEKLKKECPVDLENLSRVEGLGPKMIKMLYKNLGIKNLKDLEKAARAGKIRDLPRFGAKTEANILKGIEFAKQSKGRLLLGEVLPMARIIEKRLSNLSAVSQVAMAGSLRRRKETIGDMDILAVSEKPTEVMDFFVHMPEVKKIHAQGETKSSVYLSVGFDADLRVVESKSFGSALQYFTGSKDHNIAIRKIAIQKGMKLNEYGLFKKDKYLAGKTEQEIYEALGLKYVAPEMRENTGEIELALREAQGKLYKLPEIIRYQDIKGDLHTHSTWSDGENTLEEMAREAIKIGYEYIAITDHAGLKITGGVDERSIAKYIREIDELNLQLKNEGHNFRVLKGAEVDINLEGKLSLSDDVLAQLDVVLGSIHSGFRRTKKEMTERLRRAMENKNIDIIAHPTGRLVERREAYQLDMDEIFKIAKATGTALEINAHPERLDLNDDHIRKAVRAGVKLVISTDAHSVESLSWMEFGIAQARRGWATRPDILNTKSVEELLKSLKNS